MSKVSSRIYGVGEDGDVGSLAARGVAEVDRSGVWQAVVVDLWPCFAVRRDPARVAASLKACLEVVGTRDDLARALSE